MEAFFYFGFKLIELSALVSARVFYWLLLLLFRLIRFTLRACFGKNHKSCDTGIYPDVPDAKSTPAVVKLDPSDVQHVTGGLDRQ